MVLTFLCQYDNADLPYLEELKIYILNVHARYMSSSVRLSSVCL